ncbi:U32 family peptidase [Tistrella bauzanensis]
MVHLGEVVCAKRMPFIDPHLPAIIDRLRRAGKQVVISTLALVQGARETALVRDLTASDDWLIEANDMSAIHGLSGRPHVVGPHVNVYNPASLACLAALGAVRVCLPAELPMAGIAALAAARGAVAIEVQVFGRAPLAISARCYHARAHGLHKDGCRYVCGQDPDGMPVDTVDGQPFLAVNGLQTLSHGCLELSGWIDDLRTAGVTGFRLSPHSVDMVAVAGIYRAVIDGRMAGSDAAASIRPLLERCRRSMVSWPAAPAWRGTPGGIGQEMPAPCRSERRITLEARKQHVVFKMDVLHQLAHQMAQAQIQRLP